ncbi:MAG: hypothetical protein U0359_11115 [Byssovorax sp.]
MSKDLIEKLNYSLRMMNLIEWIAVSLGTSDDYARSVFVRHGLIYLDSFVRYGQQVRNRLSPKDTEQRKKLDVVKRDLTELHDDFRLRLIPHSDYLQIRTELTAHRHDISTEERIDAWKRIPAAFADYNNRAVYIYAELAMLDVAIPTFKTSPDTTDQRLKKYLADAVPVAENLARVGVDNLAYVRPGTIAIIEHDEIHRRLAQVLSILHTIKITANLYKLARDKSDTSRLLKAMLIVDAISLIENVYHDPSGRIGDTLLRIAYKHHMPCASVLGTGARDIDGRVEIKLRFVRNKMGAHVDDQEPLAVLVQALDDISREDLSAIIDSIGKTISDCSRIDEFIRARTIMQDSELPGVHTPVATRRWT